MMTGEKLADDVIEVLEGDHINCSTLSEKFGHSKEIMTKSATIEGRFSISTIPSPHTQVVHRRQNIKIRRFQDLDYLHESAQN